MKEEWLFPGAMVPVDVETTAALVTEIKRLIDVIGGMALAQPEQELLGNVEYIPCCTDQTCPKCKAATPPQQRKPLTDEEILDECDVVPTYDVGNSDLIKFARTIERKLKEKNT